MRQQKPSWLKTVIPAGNNYFRLKAELNKRGLSTICQSAKCPNISQCWQNLNATFLVLNNICTRNCYFCSVKQGIPEPVDKNEADNIIEMIGIMNLRYIVITSVTRDDLTDGGSNHFAYIINRIKSRYPDIRIEALIPDFCGDLNNLLNVLKSKPDVLNHNLETIQRLYPKVNRDIFNYSVSLQVLKESCRRDFLTKSGIMVGMGETIEEIKILFNDLITAGVKLLTIGQYLRPTRQQIPVGKYYTPEEFGLLKQTAMKLGFKEVESGPFVRSSYRAENMYNRYNNLRKQVIN